MAPRTFVQGTRRIYGSASSFSAVTPSDSTTFDPPFIGLYVGTGGSLSIVGLAGSAVTFANVQSGTILPISGTKVMAATTATNVVALQP